MQWLVPTKSGPRKDRQWNGDRHGHLRLIDAHGKWRLACLVQSHRRTTVVQIVANVNAGYDKMSEEAVHFSSPFLGMHNHRLPILTPAQFQNETKMVTWASEKDHGSMKDGGLIWWLTFLFTLFSSFMFCNCDGKKQGYHVAFVSCSYLFGYSVWWSFKVDGDHWDFASTLFEKGMQHSFYGSFINRNQEFIVCLCGIWLMVASIFVFC